ncbi:MAG: glycosyltransferase family 9 protein [Acidobacteria bacterium]|nr:glycosyltransferase family 9 protein [Acidobacteriota bacterium]
MDAPQKILIIRLSSLGDILHALPAYAALRRSFPAARIDWLVENRARFLLSVVAGLDEVIEIDTAACQSHPFAASSWAGLWKVICSLRRRRYDISIDFQGLLKTAALGLLIGARERVGFGKAFAWEWPAHWLYSRTVDPEHSGMHVVDANQVLTQTVGAPRWSGQVQFTVPPQISNGVSEQLAGMKLSDFVVINPGGGWPTKRWPAARYGSLAERIIRELKLEVVVTTGPGEDELFRTIQSNCLARIHHLRLSFLELIPLMKQARMVVAGDTGPLHLACAVGTPVVGIYGPTSPERNGPWLPADRYVVKVLPCSYCYGRTCPTHNECMDIPVQEVFREIAARLEAA